MVKDPQKLALEIGQTGCYALCIVAMAEEILGDSALDPLASIAWGLDAGVLSRKNGIFVEDAGGFLSLLTNQTWTCFKAGPGHAKPLLTPCAPGQREVLRFEKTVVAAGTEPAHFVRGDGFGRVLWDPYGDSETVRRGTLASKRIFTKVGG